MSCDIASSCEVSPCESPSSRRIRLSVTHNLGAPQGSQARALVGEDAVTIDELTIVHEPNPLYGEIG